MPTSRRQSPTSKNKRQSPTSKKRQSSATEKKGVWEGVSLQVEPNVLLEGRMHSSPPGIDFGDFERKISRDHRIDMHTESGINANYKDAIQDILTMLDDCNIALEQRDGRQSRPWDVDKLRHSEQVWEDAWEREDLGALQRSNNDFRHAMLELEEMLEECQRALENPSTFKFGSQGRGSRRRKRRRKRDTRHRLRKKKSRRRR